MMFGCKEGTDGKDGTDGTNSSPGTETVTISNPSGKAEAGPCYLLSDVSTMGMETNWIQTGYVLGEMISNDGSYTVPSEYATPFIVYDFNGTCFSEGDNVDVDNISMKMAQGISATEHNINHATTWRYHLAKRYYNNSSHPNYLDAAGAFVQARTDIYSYLGFPAATNNFYSLSIVGDTTADAYLLAFETAVTTGRNGPQQGNYIGEAVNAVVDNDTTFRDNLRQVIIDLPIFKTWNNLKTKLTSLGFAVDPAPLYNLPMYPAYYADIMGSTKTVQGSTNLTDTSTCSFDQYDFNLYAIPFQYISGIETSKYNAFNLPADAQVSFWTIGTDGNGNPAPGTKIIDMTALRETLLDGLSSVNLSYNGQFPDGHGLISGTWYYIVVRKDTDFVLSKSCNGTQLTTMYTLASEDEGATWIGHNNNASRFFNFTGIKEYHTN